MEKLEKDFDWSRTHYFVNVSIPSNNTKKEFDINIWIPIYSKRDKSRYYIRECQVSSDTTLLPDNKENADKYWNNFMKEIDRIEKDFGK